MRPRLLDLFCGAGGCAMGYHRSGFDVFGVDHESQPHYPFDFFKADALMFLKNLIHDRGCPEENGGIDLEDFAVIHASPPCQAYSVGKNMWKNRLPDDRHPDLVDATRKLLIRAGKHYVIENVEGSPLHDPLTLCGDMFGLGVKRHRLFECSVAMWHPDPCRRRHPEYFVSVFGGGALSRTPSGGWSNGRGNFMQKRHHVKHKDAERAMGIDWMTRDELSQAIPPAYTEWIGKQLIKMI